MSIDPSHRLGLVSDHVLARELGISRTSVRKARHRRGIPAFNAGVGNNRRIEWDKQPLGEELDCVIAERLGVNKSSVTKARKARGIPRFTMSRRRGPCPAGVILRLAGTHAEKRGESPPGSVEEVRERRRLRQLAQMKAKAKPVGDPSRLGTIYFFQCGDWIKIGWTGRQGPRARLRQIQAYNPNPVELIGTIEQRLAWDEHRLHDLFKDVRGIGEWFRATDALLEYVAANAVRP